MAAVVRCHQHIDAAARQRQHLGQPLDFKVARQPLLLRRPGVVRPFFCPVSLSAVTPWLPTSCASSDSDWQVRENGALKKIRFSLPLGVALAGVTNGAGKPAGTVPCGDRLGPHLEVHFEQLGTRFSQMISFYCPKCGKSNKVRDEGAGKKMACRSCRETILIPASENQKNWLPGALLAGAGFLSVVFIGVIIWLLIAYNSQQQIALRAIKDSQIAEQKSQAADRRLQEREIEIDREKSALKLRQEGVSRDEKRLKEDAQRTEELRKKWAEQVEEAEKTRKRLADELEEAEKDRMVRNKEEKLAPPPIATTRSKEELEKSGLAYYPLPTTKHEGKNAEQWIQYAATFPPAVRFIQVLVAVSNGKPIYETRENPAYRAYITAQNKTMAALQALKAEGMPYLLNMLTKQRLKSGVEEVLRMIDPAYIHVNDLDKIVECLSKGRAENTTRMVALRYLHSHKEAAKKHIERIEYLTTDLVLFPKIAEEAKRLLTDIAGRKRKEGQTEIEIGDLIEKWKDHINQRVRFKCTATITVFKGGNGKVRCLYRDRLAILVEVDKSDPAWAPNIDYTVVVEGLVDKSSSGVLYLRNGTVISATVK
jgi:hypothetical protein